MPANDNQPRITLITGSSRGIGKAMAAAFAERGDTVIVHATREHEHLEAALEAAREKNPSAVARAADLTDSSAIAEMFHWIESEFGRLDVLVNNAAVQEFAPLLEMSEENWDRILDTNLKAPFLCTRHAGRMHEKPGRRQDHQHRIRPRERGARRLRPLLRGKRRTRHADQECSARALRFQHL